MIRADTIRHTVNPGKVARVMAFVRPYRDCCGATAAKECRVFDETGKFGGKYANPARSTVSAPGTDGARRGRRHAGELRFQPAERLHGRRAPVEPAGGREAHAARRQPRQGVARPARMWPCPRLAKSSRQTCASWRCPFGGLSANGIGSRTPTASPRFSMPALPSWAVRTSRIPTCGPPSSSREQKAFSVPLHAYALWLAGMVSGATSSRSCRPATGSACG
jgi:hypothetical protein